MKSALFLAALVVPALMLSGCLSRCPPVKAPAPATTAVPSIMRAVYDCPFSESPIVVDGDLNEPVWEKAETVSFFVPVSLKVPISRTEAKVAYDRDFLYVAFKAYDEDVWGLLTERDSATYTEDVLEVFFKTHPDKDPYFSFEMNVRNAVMDAFVRKRNAAGSIMRWSQWDCAGLQMASKIKGTVNNWTDRDEYWILEVAIPFRSIPTLGGSAPVKGARWLFNLARFDYSIYLPKGQELSASAPLSAVSFHLFEEWTELVFQ
jgi:hypothetical protein